MSVFQNYFPLMWKSWFGKVCPNYSILKVCYFTSAIDGKYRRGKCPAYCRSRKFTKAVEKVMMYMLSAV